MDDISVITEQEIAIKVLEFIKTEGPKYGFQLNVPKTVVMPTCVVHGIKPEPKSPNWPQGISWIGDSNGVELGKEDKGARELGSFIGTKEFVTKQVIKKIDEKIAPMAELVYKFNQRSSADWGFYIGVGLGLNFYNWDDDDDYQDDGDDF